MLRAGDGLDSLTMLRRADEESDLTRASKLVPGGQILTATESANASHVVLWAGAPSLALNRNKSAVLRTVANQAPLKKLINLTPAKPQGQASVAM